MTSYIKEKEYVGVSDVPDENCNYNENPNRKKHYQCKKRKVGKSNPGEICEILENGLENAGGEIVGSVLEEIAENLAELIVP